MSVQHDAMKNTSPGGLPPGKERNLLEDLNVPPHIASWLRQNTRTIAILAGVVVLLILAWSGYERYQEKQQDKSAALLASALNQENMEAQTQKLLEVVKEYSGTDGALWSRLELAHLDYEAGKFQEAADRYQSVLSDLDPDNPVSPLVQYALARTYESLAEQDQALALYEKLAQTPGFEDLSSIAMGRIFEKKGELSRAKELFEKVDEKSVSSPWVKNKIAELNAQLSAVSGHSE